MSGLRLEVGAVFLLQMGTNCSDVARPFVARIEDFCIPPMTLGRSVSGPKPSAQVFKKLKIPRSDFKHQKISYSKICKKLWVECEVTRLRLRRLDQ